MQRLSTLDTSFLRVETPSAHMHVGWMATLALPDGEGELDPTKLAERIAARLSLAPRFRQRVAPAPLGEPMWVDHPGFRLDDHIGVEPGPVRGRRDLERVAGSFLSQQLDRGKPLWQIVVVPRAGPGRAAVLGKVHHAMVDGIAAVELGTRAAGGGWTEGAPPDRGPTSRRRHHARRLGRVSLSQLSKRARSAGATRRCP